MWHRSLLLRYARCFSVRFVLWGFCILFTAAGFTSAFGQSRSLPRDAAHIKLAMQKLGFLGSVLYVAAHPDDENTRLIAYLSNGRLAFTGYLSVTRGDGGQNRIGTELRDPLGVIRTQELLAARKIDGGKQFFTRAVDFGYSKSADETFRIWGKERILSDMVRTIRRFKPDVMVTRFPPDARAGHGHHTASAMLAKEAFLLANDPKAFPDQVAEFGLWQPKCLYTNTGRWWRPGINVDTPGVVAIDVGGYNPLLGMSYPELAAKSRTQHKSQGFGSAGRRGKLLEFFEYQQGHRVRHDLFEDVDTTWSRLGGGEHIQPLVVKLIDDFDDTDPAASVSALLLLRKTVSALADNVWKGRKLDAIDELIRDCLGLYVSAAADRYVAPPNELLTCSVEMVNRSRVPVVVHRVRSVALAFDSVFKAPLVYNTPLNFAIRKRLDPGLPYSTPYWLREAHGAGSFGVPDKALIGMPENDASVVYRIDLTVGGEPMVLHVPLMYSWVDPVGGELFRPFCIVPPLSVHLSEQAVVFGSAQGKSVDVLLKSYSNTALAGTLNLALPPGWRSTPTDTSFTLAGQGDEQSFAFRVYPTDTEVVSSLRAVAKIGDSTYSQYVQVVDYDHIPVQTLLVDAEARAVRVNLKTMGEQQIGYIAGAGDKIPAALRGMGYTVVMLDNDDVTPDRLHALDAVVLGIRAFNTNDRVPFFMRALLDYVHAGGVLLVQYNTSRGLKLGADVFSPYPLSLSRDRVTDESSAVKILLPDHPIFRVPNSITNRDFEGWVQERGLYFPNSWDSHFKPLLSMHDPNEGNLRGSLLVAPYGKGYYIYTGLSFFRQLPAGVPGAYKLFANLLSMGKANK